MVWMGGAFGGGSDELCLLDSEYGAGYDCEDG